MVKHDQIADDRQNASRAAAGRMLMRLGGALERLDVWTTEAPDDEHYVMAFNLKVRYDTVGDVLAMVKADTVDGKVIGFHAAETMSAALLGLIARMDNGTLIWREDKPYESRDSNR